MAVRDRWVIVNSKGQYLIKLPYWSLGEWTDLKAQAKIMSRSDALAILDKYSGWEMELV